MELSPRKQAVLKAIIKAYIETGEPVGSKNLTALLENAPSSATLRNEMSELCSLGFLHQPHTSAGRVPTNNGYRMYIESLMHRSQPTSEVVAFIDNAFDGMNCEPEGIPAAAAQALSRFTGLPAIACLITEKPTRIKRIELLPIGKYSAMLLVITHDGRTRSRVFRFGRNFGSEQQKLFDTIVEQRIKGKAVSELTKPYMQSVIAGAGLYALELMPLLTAVFETAAGLADADVTLSGESALYNICADDASARRILNLVKQRDPIISILERVGEGVGAVFGTDTVYGELKNDTIIAAKFSGADKYRGYVGVIGPNRMSYEHIMPGIEYTAERLTKIMTEAQKDMED